MTFIIDGPEDGPTFIFTHGAGADACSEFMNIIAQGLANRGIRVVRFNFPYMQQRLIDGIKRPPNRAPQLVDFFSQIVKQSPAPVYIGGKSMGGRIASMVAAQNDPQINDKVKGIICLGYPFHPQGKPEKLRISHLQHISAPLFIAQGTRDKLGNIDEVTQYAINKDINFLWLEDGDHDFKPRVRSGFTAQQHCDNVIETLAKIMMPLPTR